MGIALPRCDCEGPAELCLSHADCDPCEICVDGTCRVDPDAGTACATCGDDHHDPGEACDGDCPTSCADTDPCTADTMTGHPDRCDVACHNTPIVACASGDGCCPVGCGIDTDGDCPTDCGNTDIDDGETCDPPATCPQSCADTDPCTADTMSGAPHTCNVRCENIPIERCVHGDGCCPEACDLSSDVDCVSQIEEHQAAYDSLQAELDLRRVTLVEAVGSQLFAAGDRLFWVTTSGSYAALHSHYVPSGTSVHYTFDIGTASTYDYRTDGERIAVVDDIGPRIDYQLYAAEAPALLQLERSYDVALYHQWYDLADGQLYVITNVDGHELFRDDLSADPAVRLTSLEETGVTVGGFMGFTVGGEQLYFAESNRLWELDLVTLESRWLENERQLYGEVVVDGDHLLYGATTGKQMIWRSTLEEIDLAEAIAASPYRINGTFSTSHLLDDEQVMTAALDHLIYIGWGGVFAFQPDTGEIHPILLDPRDDSDIRYRYPAVLPSGTLCLVRFTTGFFDEGEIVAVDLTEILTP